ncbi:MAG: hypothetical protein ACFFD9_06210 [Candidatus Thorarchaeota archaeon]
MKPTVVKIEPDMLRETLNSLLKSKRTMEVPTTNQYERFRLKCNKGTIVGYMSGKIVATGQSSEALLQDTIRRMDFVDAKHGLTIGSDEAGKGEWLGPLTVSAVGLTSNQATELRALGVMDSKDVSPNRIAELAQDIEDHCEAMYTVLISPSTFNDRFEELHREGKDLNDLLAWAHAKAISEVYKLLKPSEDSEFRVVVDEFSRLKTKIRLDRVLDLDSFELVQKPRAEDVISVAAASIIAKDAREDWIESASERIGIDLRSLNPKEALKRDDLNQFAKTSYLRKRN